MQVNKEFTMSRPQQTRHDLGNVLVAAAFTLLMAALAAVRAQQPTPSPTPSPSPSPSPSAPAKPLVPVAASTLASNPDAYYGAYVTLAGAVDQSLAPLAFSIDQDKTKSTGKDVLILVPRLNSAVDLNTYVTVLGEVVRFDPAEIARKTKDYNLDLPQEVIEKYRGRPAVLATAVLNAAMVDLAKRLPPPMTRQEEAYDKVMKRVGPSFAALRQAMGASDAAQMKKETDVLKQAFSDVEGFWKTRAKADATQWARDARKNVEAIDRAAAGGKWDDVKTSVGTLGQACQTCHAAYRERFDDGTFRIKTGT